MNSKSYTILLKTALVVFSCLFTGSLFAQDENILIVTTANDIADAPDTTSIAALKGNKGADGLISLREAISACNNTAGLDTIKFSIGTGLQTINVAAEGLPVIHDPLYLDATTQPGYSGDPIIQLNGSATAVGEYLNGLYLRTNNSTVKGFIVHSFQDEGIEIDGSTGYGDNNVIENNWCGITSIGAAAGNGDEGILISVDADGNTIRNNISSSNGGDGLEIHTNSDNNWIWGNIFGLGIDGTTIRGNSGQGLRIGGNGNIIGTNGDTIDDAAERNIISGNYWGIYVTSSSTGDIIAGNYIGLDVTGTQDKGNSDAGIFAQDVTNLTINNNVISNNDNGILLDNSTLCNIYGNYIGTDITGTVDMGNTTYGIEILNSASNQIGGKTPADRNVISGNEDDGITFWGNSSTLNVVQGNYIGVDKTGNAALGNTTNGVKISGGANNNTIGGDRTAGEGNVISGNEDGFQISNSGTNNNKIYGNYIGTNFDGTTDIANWRIGVVLYNGVQGTQIGGSGTGQGNIISGNTTYGLIIDGNGVTTINNTISSNYIGTDVTGTSIIANDGGGVKLFGGASNNTIGGTTAAHRNIVSGNIGYGIVITGATTTGNTILGNYIGTDVTGIVDLGNSTDGIVIKDGSYHNTVGGITSDHRNIISGNDNDGIWITGSGTYGNTVQGNWIGLNAAEGALGNSFHGMGVESSTYNNQIGGTSNGMGNKIFYNAWDGIAVGSGNGNAILGNEFKSNGDLAIDLEGGTEDGNGVTSNDTDDGDSGSNNLQNYPVLTSATTDESTTLIVYGSLNSTPSTSYRIEFFASSSADPSGYGEGETLLGDTTVTTDSGGDVVFSKTITGKAVSDGYAISSTATDPSNNTSEFSGNVVAQCPTGKIGDLVWNDINGDGIQDGGESGLQNVLVLLYDSGDTQIDNTTTDVNGNYTFTNVTPGDYYVKLIPPANYVFSPQDATSDALDSDADTVTGETILTTISLGENDLTWDAGMYYPATSGDFVWLDADENGIQDGGEVGIENITINLRYDGGGLAQSTTTNGAGLYSFANIIPGDYYLEFILPAEYSFSPIDQGGNNSTDSDANTSTGQTAVTTLTAGENDPSWDAGMYLLPTTASIGDYVWHDLDYNGVQDAGEPGFDNVTVDLYLDDGDGVIDGGDTHIGQQTTSGGGYYNFIGLVPGDYLVTVTDDNNILDGYLLSAGSDPEAVTLIVDQIFNDADFGYYLDLTNYDYGDLPAPYHTLRIDNGARHIYDGITFLGNPGSTNSDFELNGQPNASATGDDINGTDDDDGVTFLTPFIPGESARISISAGVAGYLNSWIDFNNDGDFSDVGEQIADDYYLNSGSNQIEIEAVSNSAVGTINSRFRFTAGLGEANTPFGTAPNGEVEDYKLNSIQCFVWEDLYNGKQNEGEPGLNNAVVFLYNDIMSPIAGIQTKNHPITDEPGWCEFPGVPQGNYYLQFNLLGGYSFTIKDAGNDDSIDSDADEITGFSDVVNITSSGEVFRVDAGMKENTQIDFGDLPEVYQTYTANDGPGHIVDSEIYLGSSVPDSETNGQPNSTATGDDIDGNNDDDGITFLHPLHPDRQVDISIEASINDRFLNAWIDFNNNSTFSDPGEHIAIDIELNDGNNIYSLPAIPSTATGPMHSRFRFSSDTGLQWYGPASDGEVEDYALGIIGNFIWVDINGDGAQNDGDYSGLNDVQVNLLDGSGNPVLDKLGNPIFTVTKNSSQNGYPGYYEFPGLPPGNYMIEVIELPGYDFTTKDNSGDDETDSDVDAVTGRSDVISITLGLNNDFSDAGFYIDNPTSIGDYIWNDFDGDGIQDGSEVGIGQITIELYRDINHDNLLDAGDVLIRQQTTETDGSYEFMGLIADDYLVMVTDDNGILGYYSISGGTNPHNIELSAGQDYNEADFGYKTFDFDFGDLPLPYPTTMSNNGPRHPSLETGDVKMGLRMDTEIDGQEHDNAYADDSDKGPTLDDEDGVSFITPLHPGRNAQVNISMPVINSSGYINAWIDFNTDGDFDDTDERIATDFFIEYGNANSLLFLVPEDASGVEYSRFRLTLNSEEVTSYTGTAPNGEVEDYALGTISGYVFDDIYGDGLQDVADPIIPGVLVKLLDEVGSPILDADNNPITILTDENGFYEFPGLFPNYYILEFVKQGGTVFTIPNRVHESLYNSKANVLSGRTSTMIVENGSVFNDIYVGIFNDADNDHVPDVLEGNSDNDSDGLINSNDYDPAGYIYDGTSGEILSGGLIEVSGPGIITIIEDGSSGYYEFYTDGTEGVYTIELTPPSGYEISSTCASLDPPAFDPTGEPNPIYLGSSESGSTGFLSDFDCVDNPYYYTFDLESGDPFIINNNFPLEQITTGTIGDYVLNDVNLDGLQDAGDVGIENVKLTLFDGTSTEIAFTFTDSEGWYEFTGLIADDYTITIDENTLGEFVYLSYEYDGIEVPGALVSLGEGEINLDLDFGYKDTPLPITLASFGIEKSLEGIKVMWTTESEIENQGFVIERRVVDANDDWNEIASFLTETELKGQGTVTYSTNYEYIDQLIIPGNTYEYRLGDVDYNGFVTYHATEIIKIDITDKFGIPSSFTVNPAYPNPFNPSTVIEYALPKTGKIKIAIFDILGHRVKSIVNTEQSAGWHSITWNGVDDNGSSVPAGMYFGVIITEYNKKTVKLMFVK